MEADEVGIWWAWAWRVDIFSTLSHVVDGLTDKISQVLMFLTIAVR